MQSLYRLEIPLERICAVLERLVDDISKLTVSHSLIVICANSRVSSFCSYCDNGCNQFPLQMPSSVLDDCWASLDNVLWATVFMTMSIYNGGLWRCVGTEFTWMCNWRTVNELRMWIRIGKRTTACEIIRTPFAKCIQETHIHTEPFQFGEQWVDGGSGNTSMALLNVKWQVAHLTSQDWGSNLLWGKRPQTSDVANSIAQSDRGCYTFASESRQEIGNILRYFLTFRDLCGRSVVSLKRQAFVYFPLLCFFSFLFFNMANLLS